ncbi:MAG: putative molybdenum carrier protein [Mariprofundaceae bacterium]
MTKSYLLKKVISGGQTGVDRAALDAAMRLGVEIGGWCPKGRRALDGVIPSKYLLTETREKTYQTRTKWNVRDSDASLIICRDEPTGGTALTIKYCEQLGKPYQVYQLKAGEGSYVGSPEDPQGLVYWLNTMGIKVLNVAGPREGKYCPVYDHAYRFLVELLRLMQRPDEGNDYVYEAPALYQGQKNNLPMDVRI